MNTLEAPSIRGSETSEAAAQAIKPSVTQLQQEVFDAIQFFGGATDDQVQEFTGLAGSTQRPRRIELVRMGKIKDSGLCAKTRSGRAATIWVVA